MTWWHYLLLVNLYLLLFYGFYAALLRNETFFQLNRVYLVAGALLSFIIPMVQADWIKQLFITQKVQQTIYSTIYHPEYIYQAKPAESVSFTIGQIFAVVYIAGTVFLVGRFVLQLLAVKRLIANLESSAAFSFFKKVRIDAELPDQQTIIDHEEVHVKQWHSADVLLIEAVMIINWFNPIVYFYRKAIKHVHEFIADKKAIERGTSKTEYAYLLLSQSFGARPHQLTNNFFNKSLLKARIIMLNKDESKRRMLLKYGLSAPLFIVMLIFSSATVKNSSVIRIINRKTEQMFSVNTLSGQIPDSVQVAFADKMLNQVEIGSPKSAQKLDINTDSVTPTPLPQPVIIADNKSPEVKDIVFTAVEIAPEFPGGEDAFSRFLQRNLKYPKEAKDNNVQGKVYVQFVVQNDGNLADMKVLREPGSGLGDEALRVLAQSPRWHPGIQNGRQVKVQYTVPINFSMSSDNEKVVTTDTPHHILNIVNRVRLNGVDYPTAKTTAPVAVMGYAIAPDKDKMKLTLQATLSKRLPDSAVYVINGKPATAEDLKKIKPETIKLVQVIDNYSAKVKAADDAQKKPVINIFFREVSAEHQ